MADQLIEGIDVSLHQINVDWSPVFQSDISFVFARATLGGHQVDSQFASNRNGVVGAGLNRGAYHYFWPATPWQEHLAFPSSKSKVSSG